MDEANIRVASPRYAAVLFDLDGVLTATAKVHAVCWKRLFDTFLKKHADRAGESFRPFDIDTDYRLHVDGKPRFDGVRDFLRSRGIVLDEGPEDAAADSETVHGLGNGKDRLVTEILRTEGVDVYPGSIDFVRRVREDGLRTAVVSSSRNAAAVLKAAGIDDLFELCVDGNVARDTDLEGKPAPDTFLEAARQLGVAAERTVVVEDAISGVRAGHDGGFGLVIGIARHGDPQALREAGADVVVSDLSELPV